METILHSLDPREDEEAELELEDDAARPAAMSGAPVLKIGEGCYLTLPILSD
jgi:hypothetical protein